MTTSVVADDILGIYTFFGYRLSAIKDGMRSCPNMLHSVFGLDSVEDAHELIVTLKRHSRDKYQSAYLTFISTETYRINFKLPTIHADTFQDLLNLGQEPYPRSNAIVSSTSKTSLSYQHTPM